MALTWPTAKGRVLLKENTSWWTPLLRKTSFTNWPRWLSKKESCTGTIGKAGLSWSRLDNLGLRGFLADCRQLLRQRAGPAAGTAAGLTPRLTTTHAPEQCS